MSSSRLSGEYPSIVFFGTPPFASKILKHLMSHHFRVSGVVTAPDKPAGRGRKVITPSVKETALSLNLPVLQPVNLKDPGFQEALKNLNPDIQVVVAFRMLPKAVWELPALGTFNLHASLLPQYRGAAPIQWALINGEKITGVTTFLLSHEIDTGKIILQEQVPIDDEDDAGSLSQKLLDKGADIVVRSIEMIKEGNLTPVDQNEIYSGTLTHAPKLKKEDTVIHWEKSPEAICNLVRAMSPSPGALTYITLDNGKQYVLKIFKAIPVNHNTTDQPPTLGSDNKTYLEVMAKQGTIRILALQLEGKKRMSVEEFLKGFQPERARITG